VEHIRQSRPDSGLGFQVKVLKTFQVVLSLLSSCQEGRCKATWTREVKLHGRLSIKNSLSQKLYRDALVDAEKAFSRLEPQAPPLRGDVRHQILHLVLDTVLLGSTEGCRESRRCSRYTYPESCITKYPSIRRIKKFPSWSKLCSGSWLVSFEGGGSGEKWLEEFHFAPPSSGFLV